MTINRYIQKHGKRLYGLCRHLCSNAADADDLYQETWLRAMKHFSKYDPSKDFEPWVTRICVNAHRNALRRLTRNPVLDFSSSEEKEALMRSAPAPEEQDHSLLHEAVGRLPEKLRLTVVLFYFHDMNVASTAEVLGIPQGTVKSRLSKARKLLREELADEQDLRL